MVHRGRLHVIDFQDARMGPYTYDSASLLRDSSLDLEKTLVDGMIDHLGRYFDLMALQRNIKDLGTFGYMATARDRREYLDYVPRTVASIRRNLAGSRRYHLFHPLLERYVLS